MQNNTTMRYLKTIILAKMLAFQMRAGCEGEALVQSWRECKLEQQLWGAIWQHFEGNKRGPWLSTLTRRAKMSAQGHLFALCVTEKTETNA